MTVRGGNQRSGSASSGTPISSWRNESTSAASPVPVSYGRPSQPPSMAVSVGPTSALSQRVDVGRRPAHRAESLAPTSAFDERVNVGRHPRSTSGRASPSGPGTCRPGRPCRRPREQRRKPLEHPAGRPVGVRAGTVDRNRRGHHRCRHPGSRRWRQRPRGPSVPPQAPTGDAPARPSTPTRTSRRREDPGHVRDYQTIKYPAETGAPNHPVGPVQDSSAEKNEPLRARYIDAETALVADIHAVLDRDKGQAKAQARYVTDAQRGVPRPAPDKVLQS